MQGEWTGILSDGQKSPRLPLDNARPQRVYCERFLAVPPAAGTQQRVWGEAALNPLETSSRPALPRTAALTFSVKEASRHRRPSGQRLSRLGLFFVCILFDRRNGPTAMEPVKVVIADDDPLTRLDLHRALDDLGLRVLGEAEDGRQALSLARTLRPDLLILDIKMPGMDGLDAARIARGEHLGAVMLLTGYAEDDMIAKADAAGVLAYLRKPFRTEELGPAIAIALGRYRERQALETDVEDLKEKMESRKVVGRAKAILMERHHLSEREAFYRIQAQSQTLQKPASEIARAIITASELGI